MKKSRRLELIPYVTAGIDHEPVVAGDPLNSATTFRRDIGLDFKYGLGRAFTLSGTVNPDFGQVEADPSLINLTANELFLAEKRPFFLEGTDLFHVPIGTSDSVEGAFYSRRIGAQPPNEPTTYLYIDWPPSTRIYSAAKLTGKSIGGWSVGLLDAVTGQETASVVDLTGLTTTPVVVPLTNYAIGRLKRDVNEGKTTIGIDATAVDRKVGDTAVADNMADQAYTGGVQILHRWWDDKWLLDFRTVESFIHGSSAAIRSIEEDNVHLFQRPDATDTHLEPFLTSMFGTGASWAVGRLGTVEHWRFGTGGDLRTPGLELNDAGYQTIADRMTVYLQAQYREDYPSAHVLNWQITNTVFGQSTFEPRLLTSGAEVKASVQFCNYWSLSTDDYVADNRWDPQVLRGGPALHLDPTAFASVNFTSDSRRHLWASLGAHGSSTWDDGAVDGGLDVGVTVQALSNVDLYLGPSIYARHDPMQYVTQADDLAGTPHYVVGRIAQTTTSLTVRANWTLSPRISMQLYAEAFVATGDYTQFRDVVNPHAAHFADRFHLLGSNEYFETGGTVYANYNGDYSFSNPDFDLRQLRANAVVRWEYRSGSAVFVSWSHGLTSQIDEQIGATRDLGALFTRNAEDIFLVKVNYWLGL